jgi:RNA polymerase sigma factor (sigma-70 family)
MRAMKDEELVDLLNRGEATALDELYRRYAQKLHVFCATTMSSGSPEDMVHDVFLLVLRSSSQFDARRAPFATWLFQVARNRCRDASRRNAKVPMASLDDGAAGSVADDRGDRIAEGLDRRTVAEAVRGCVEQLRRDDERQALVLYHLVGKAYREVGEMIGKSTSMAQKLVGQAREQMKRCLTGKGVKAW